MKQVEEVVKQLLEISGKIRNLENEVTQMRSSVYGSESVDEDLASKFYREIAETASELEKQKQILQDTGKSLNEDKAKLDELKKNAYNKLTNVKFPLRTGSEGIETKNGDVIFLFDRDIDSEVLQEVEKLLGISLSSDRVKILGDRIELKDVASIPDAMRLIMAQVEKIRKAAMNQLKIDDYVKELRGRDGKIQKMLYVLYEARKPLNRKDMETKAGLEPASLRGVLYYVQKSDPYLKKLDRGKFELTPLGKNVMEKYEQKYGSPLLKKDEIIDKEKTLTNYARASSETASTSAEPRQSGGVPNQ